MSWGATGYTPIVVYNEPPFGFAERQSPPDFPVDRDNPYIASDYLKTQINGRLAAEAEKSPCINPDRECLVEQTRQLREGFLSGGTLFLLGTVALTIVSAIVSNNVSFAAAGKFTPSLEAIPFLDKLPPKYLSNLKFLKRFAGKSIPISAIVFAIVMPIMVFFTMWLANAIVLQSVILRECGKVDVKQSFVNALGGTIPTTVVMIVAMIVLFILQRIPIFTVPLGIIDALGVMGIIYGIIMLTTNLTFSWTGLVAIRKNVCGA